MISLSEFSGIAIVKMENGVTNAISREFIRYFTAVINDIEKTYKGIIITGNEKFFSMGFYLPELLTLSPDEFVDFYDSFNDLIIKIFTLSIPTCSLLEGHSVAGGFIIALSTDFRIGVSNKKIGLNEINLGVPVPFLAKELLSRLADSRNTKKLLYTGNFITTDEGNDIGIIDEISALSDILDKGLKIIDTYSSKSSKALKVIKKSISFDINSSFEKYRDWDRRCFLDCWYDKETQSILKETAKKF